MCRESGLGLITTLLQQSTPDELDQLRELLAVGIHSHVQVTDVPDAATAPPIYVSQAYCSALPVSVSVMHSRLRIC